MSYDKEFYEGMVSPEAMKELMSNGEEDLNRAITPDSLDHLTGSLSNITVDRTSVHNKNIAPKGCVYFVAKAKDKSHKYTMSKLVFTQGLTPEAEHAIKLELASKLKKHFKL